MGEVNMVVGGISSKFLMIEVDACLLVVVEAERRAQRMSLSSATQRPQVSLETFDFLCPVSHDRHHDNDLVKQGILVSLLNHLTRESRPRAIVTWKQPLGNLAAGGHLLRTTSSLNLLHLTLQHLFAPSPQSTCRTRLS